MTFLRLREIRSMTSEGRKKKLTELKTELMKLRAMVEAGGAVENPARIREIRRAVARILTVEGEGARKTQPAEAKA